jgi:hypothetical protein
MKLIYLRTSLRNGWRKFFLLMVPQNNFKSFLELVEMLLVLVKLGEVFLKEDINTFFYFIGISRIEEES